MRDLYSNIEVRRAYSPVATAQTDNTAIVTEIIDTRGFSSLVFSILLGILADADMTATILMEHGDDSGLSDAAAVPDTQIDPTEAIMAFDFADDNSARKMGYTGDKRYVRMTITPVANTGDVPIGVLAILSHAHHKPTTAQAT